ncbi:Mitochondrial ribosomal protein L11 [Operophtera brumata]|uniref:Large ribosomal subunit protein uL11m n=1 Tax=Operophtera brumata TaxID=104452 RepID=A0A0L7LCX5_OPEBR|nr:Mitochondrial ribosomal protein L11 [Operophtera brumata]
MSKSVARLKSMKKVADKLDHSSKLRTNIPAGMAAAGPPLGPMLGQQGVPLPTRVKLNSDRSYQLTIHQPPVSYFLKQAAGISRGAMEPAKIKKQDPPLEWKSLKEICTMLIATARTCGIEVVKELDPKEYGEFLQERKKAVEEQRKALQEKREAKMLRTA